jgi:hypothetical protein
MLRQLVTVCILLLTTFPSLAEDRGNGNSYEELFMGLHRPLDKMPPQPKPATTPAETANALYGNEVFFNLRNSFPKQMTDYLAPCFSKDLLQHFDSSRDAIEKWSNRNKDTLMKLPMNEGAIFVGNYEGAASFRIGETLISHDTAKVFIHLAYTEAGTKVEWTDIAIFIRSSNVWLLNDIVFDRSNNSNITLRKRTTLEVKP